MEELETMLKDFSIANDIALITMYGSILLNITDDKKLYNYLSKELSKEHKKIKNSYLKEELNKEYLKKFINNHELRNYVTIADIIKKGIEAAGIAAIVVHAYDHKEDILKLGNYYQTALNAKEIYKDNNVYNYLRRECIETFNSIKDKKLRDEIIRYIDPKFLKYKQ